MEVFKFNYFLLLMFIFATLNCNGCRGLDKLNDIITSSRADILCLQETHWNDNFIERYKHLIKGKVIYSNSPDGYKGVAFVINKDICTKVNSYESDKNGRIIKISIDIDENVIDIINVYAPNKSSERYDFFECMSNLVTKENTIIVGDFNTVLHPCDRTCGKLEPDKSREKLFKVMSQFNLQDIWHKKYPDRVCFTWRRLIENIVHQSRIDFFLVPNNLSSFCQNIHTNYTSFSDHSIVTLCCDFSNIDRGPGLYILNNSVLIDKEYCKQVQRIIQNQLSCSLYREDKSTFWDNLKYKIKTFSRNYGRKSKSEKYRKINSLQKKLEQEFRRASIVPNHDMSVIVDLEQQLADYELERCQGAALRSRAQWTHDSDRNTNYFLRLEKHRQENKVIRSVTTNSGHCVSDGKSVLEEVRLFYSDLYKYDDIEQNALNEMLCSLDGNVLNEVDVEFCDNRITMSELTEALNGMSKNKTPGNDSLTVSFYVKFWADLGPVLLEVVNEIFEKSELSRTMKGGVISLIYKQKGDKSFLKNWRPISLLNVDYKIISRCLANRLKKVIASIINECQTCCVPGRDIGDTICSLRDAMWYVEHDQIETYFLKLDQEKAFDRVSHEYINAVLNKFGFGDYFSRWIKILYKDIRSAVKVNGHITKYFSVNKSVRQGCPISALLYVLSVEPLGAMIRANNNVRGLSIPYSERTCTVFQHADDTTVVLTDKECIKDVIEITQIFGKASNAKLNLDKCEILPVGVHITESKFMIFLLQKIVLKFWVFI